MQGFFKNENWAFSLMIKMPRPDILSSLGQSLVAASNFCVLSMQIPGSRKEVSGKWGPTTSWEAPDYSPSSQLETNGALAI